MPAAGRWAVPAEVGGSGQAAQARQPRAAAGAGGLKLPQTSVDF